MRLSIALFLSFLLLATNNEAAAFKASSTGSSSGKKALDELNVKQKSVAGMTKLRFQASTNYATMPVKCSNHHKLLADFFFRDEHRDMILSGSASRNRVEVMNAPDIALYHLWQVQADKNHMFASPVVCDDPILRVTTTGIRFPGLALRTVATVGCKQVVRRMQQEEQPELQITLLDNELQAEGPEPLVWVFNKLTGISNEGNRKDNPAPTLSLFPPFLETPKAENNSKFTTHSTNTITAEKTADGSVVFRSVARLVIDVSFPSFLLRILPVSKQMAEEQGSKSIQKVVERDIGPSLEALRKRYIDFVQAETD